MPKRNIPYSVIDFNTFPPELPEMSEAEVEVFRAHIFDLDSKLSRAESNERIYAGLLLVVILIDAFCGLCWFRDTAKWVIVNGILSILTVYIGILFARARESRIGIETLYYSTILGRAYKP